jgi:uncharacterized membrane protein
MSLIGKLHPLLVHFPIALVLMAAAAEFVAVAGSYPAWRPVAVANLRAGGAIAVMTAIAGWWLASLPIVDHTPALEWHRWVGISAAVATASAALLSSGYEVQSPRSRFAYRVALFGAALLVAIAGDLGGTLVWGAGFLRP